MDPPETVRVSIPQIETVWVSIPEEPGVEEPGSDRCVVPRARSALIPQASGAVYPVSVPGR